jgi:hypothetical protein
MSQESKVIVKRIMDAKVGNNQDYKLLQVIQETKREGADSFLSNFLGGNFVEKRVAIQNIHVDMLAKFNITEGCDLSEAMKLPMKVKITELTQSEFNELEEADQLGFSAKINPETEEELATADGEPIYRKCELRPDAPEETDKRVTHVKAMKATATEGIKAVTEAEIVA